MYMYMHTETDRVRMHVHTTMDEVEKLKIIHKFKVCNALAEKVTWPSTNIQHFIVWLNDRECYRVLHVIVLSSLPTTLLKLKEACSLITLIGELFWLLNGWLNRCWKHRASNDLCTTL